MIAVRLLRDGAVVREAVFKDAPLALGRGADCDFAIVDESVSRRHAALERDPAGVLVLRDLDSRNGLFVGPRRVQATAVAGRLRCLLGGALVEIEADAEALTQEIRQHDWRSLERRRGPRDHARYLLLGGAGWMAALAADPGFWSPWEKGRAVAALGHLLGALVGLPVLAALTLIGLKAFGRRLRLADTLAALARLVWLAPLAELVSYGAYYPLGPAGHARFRAAAGAAVLAYAASSLASLRRPGPSRAFRLVCAAAVLGIAAGAGLTARLAALRAGEPELDFHVQMPLGGHPGRAEPLDDYLRRFAAAADAAAAQAAARRERED